MLHDVKYDSHLITSVRDFVSDARKLEAITVLRCQWMFWFARAGKLLNAGERR